MRIKNSKIVDERQEYQNLQNTSIVFTVMILMLAVFLVIQTLFMQRGFSYFGPEFITLITASILKIILDIRQGIVYTKTNAKTKLTVALYVSAALIFAVLLGIRNYLLYDFALWKITLVIIPVFLEMLILFGAVHFTYMKLSKKRLEKLEQKFDEEE
jgi:CDP-diglyceride synthetase